MGVILFLSHFLLVTELACKRMITFTYSRASLKIFTSSAPFFKCINPSPSRSSAPYLPPGGAGVFWLSCGRVTILPPDQFRFSLAVCRPPLPTVNTQAIQASGFLRSLAACPFSARYVAPNSDAPDGDRHHHHSSAVCVSFVCFAPF